MLIRIKVIPHVETVCLLSKLHEAKHHVNVKLDMDEMQPQCPKDKEKAIMEALKAYKMI